MKISNQSENNRKKTGKEIASDKETEEAFKELEKSVYAALETYSNVHRGSGHFSATSTYLFDQAREIVLDYLNLKKGSYAVIFCYPRGAEILSKQLKTGSYKIVSSDEIGLALGVRALAVKRHALSKITPYQTGGGTARLISKEWIIWANAPEKFEAGTPSIIPIIAFAKALNLIKHSGKNLFINPTSEKRTAFEIVYPNELKSYSGKELLDQLRQTLIGRNVQVPCVEGMRTFINLDNSASTPTFETIWDTYRHTWQQPKSTKQEIVNEVKSICAKALGAPQSDYDVLFTSNATEAINLVAESFCNEPNEAIEPVILNTLLEHSSNDLPWRTAPGHTLIRLSIDTDGFIDLKEMERLLDDFNKKGLHGKKQIRLVAVTGASNVLGVCNNIKEISEIAHRYDARLLVDAAQWVAHRKIDIEGLGIDYLAFSAHKVYAPFGSGALIVGKKMLSFNSEEMKQIRLSGEENTAGIAALGKALALLQQIGMNVIEEEEQVLTKQLLQGLSQIEGIRIHGIKEIDSPAFAHKVGVIAFNMNKLMSNRVAKELALRSGIGVRYGCHCAHILIKHILNVGPKLERFQRFMQTFIPKLRFPGVVRVSLGIGNNKEEVDQLIDVLKQIAYQTTNIEVKDPSMKIKLKEAQKQTDDFIIKRSNNVYSSISL